MALSLIAFTPRSAAGQDYGLEQADWNGMRDLVDLAESAQIELTLEETLDFDTLDLEEPLLIVYPHQPLRADSLSRYVVEGGRVLLADDFGQSTPLLQRLDVDRLEPLRGTLPHQEFLQQNPALPVFRARGEHALLEGVEVIVANHPAVLFNVGGPVLEYDEDGGLVYDMNLGQGKVIVLGDSSLLINHMLPVADNAALVRNALDYVCRAKRPCRLHAYVGDFEQRGAYGERDEIFGDKEEISVQVEKLNEYVDTLMRELPAAQLFYYLSVLIALGLVAYLVAIFPLRRTRPYSAYVQDTLSAIHAPQSEFDWNIGRYLQAGSATNFALPVAILKEHVERLVLEDLGLWEHTLSQRPTVPEIAQLFADQHLSAHSAEARRKLKRKMTELLAAFATVPTRQRIFLDVTTFFGERDLTRIYRDSMDILDVMDLKERYERRVRTSL